VEPDPDLLRCALGSKPVAAEPIAGGYTRSHAWRVVTRDGLAFVKQADEEGSLHMLRREAIVYRNVREPFLPAFVGFADAGARAVLAIEYIADCRWPPPYPDDVALLFEALAAMAATQPPDGLPRVSPLRASWKDVAADPEPLLALGPCSQAWLEQALPALIDAESRAEWTGDALVHHDVYSGNLGFQGNRVVLVDWGAASIGSPWSDVAFALLSIRSEGGPLPTLDIPDEGAWAAALTAHFAVETPKPLPAWADAGSTLRADMAQDLAVGLRWCVEALELPPLP